MRASVLTSAEYQKTSCSNHAAPTLDLVETRMASCQESSAAPDSWRPHSVDTDSSQSSPQQNARPRHISEMRQDTEVQVQDPASWRLYLAQMITLWHSWLPSEAGRHPSPCKGAKVGQQHPERSKNKAYHLRKYQRIIQKIQVFR